MKNNNKWRHEKKSETEVYYFMGESLKMIIKREEVAPFAKSETPLYTANVQTFKRTNSGKNIVPEHNFYWNWSNKLQSMGYACWNRRSLWEVVCRR